MSVVYIFVPQYIINREDNTKRKYCIYVIGTIILLITVLDMYIGWMLGFG